VNKSALRRWAKEKRRTLDLEAFARASLPQLAELLRGKAHVLIYAPLPHEPDPRGLLALLPQTRFYLPKVQEKNLLVLPYREPLSPGAFGVLEPAKGPPFPPQRLDAVLVPALAYDRRGFRLGHGKGYYDRFLARLSPHALTVGWVPSALLLDTLPTDPWDRPVKLVVTEKGVLKPGVSGPEDAPF